MSAYARFFTTRDGARIAYAVQGAGPPLVYLPPFLSHLELMWEAPAFRAFNEALAADFTLIRYDRLGCGLSDRDRTDFTLAADIAVLADLIDHLRLRRVALLGISAGGPVAIHYAVDHPRRVSHLLLFGLDWVPTPATPVRSLVNELFLADMRVGSAAFADYLLPDAEPGGLAWFARIIREEASAETAVRLARLEETTDIGELVPGLRVPTLVMHRRGDRLAPLDGARAFAARIPGARFAPLPGNAHLPEFGDAGDVLRAIRGFVAADGRRRAAEPRDPDSFPVGLSERESDVLRLIAQGLTNREIAARLSLSVHTVERHAANLYAKLGVRGRAAATAYALGRAAPQHDESA